MPSVVPILQRRRRANELESDRDDSSDERGETYISREGTPFSQASNGSKRVRLSAPDNSENGGNDTSGSLESDSDDGADPAEVTRSRNTLYPSVVKTERGSRTKHSAGSRQPSAQVIGDGDGSSPKHRPGSIVRVKLTDFVTYTSAEFFPGPGLNMVIGPNGTGKSTLHLGRAKDPAEFVKHGCEEATIEIELAKGPGHRQNPIIRRTIVRRDNKSTFTLNGKPSTKARVLELAHSFSIQIDNLCQFLPQDKVAEFAALSPINLLHSTQRAAAGPEMIEWHESLKTLRAEQKKLLAANAEDREQLANLQNRQELQRVDVERMQQRALIQKKIALLEKARPIPKFQEARQALKDARQKRRDLHNEQMELENQLAPALKSVNEKRDYSLALHDVVAQKRDMVVKKEELSAAIVGKLDKVQDTIKDLDAQIEAEKKAGITHRENYKKSLHLVNKIKRQMEEEPVEFDVAAFTNKIRDTVRELRDIEEKSRSIQESKKSTFRDHQIIKGKIVKEYERLQNLDSESGRQAEKLKSLSADTAKAWEWIKANQSRFEKKVFGPPLVECSIKDPTYADAIESLLQRNDFLTFTAQCRNDFRILQRVLYSELKLHDISLKVSSITLSDLRSPITDEELRSLGFDSWARDLLTGPEPVVAMLCSENRLHQTPIARRDITDEEYTRLINSPISSWVTGSQSYQVVRRREYGPSAISTRVRQLRPARHWTSQPVDVSARSSIENNIQELKKEFDTLQGVLDEQRESLENFKGQYQKAQREKVELEQEKATKQTALMNFKALPTKMAQLQGKAHASEIAMDAVKKRVEALRNKQDQVSLEKASIALEYATCVNEFQYLIEDLALAEVNLLEAVSDLDTLKERNTEVNRILNNKKAELAQAIEEFTAATTRFNECQEDFQAFANIVNNDPELQNPEMRELIDATKNLTIEQLEAEIDSEKAALELTGEDNSNVIKEFEMRQQRIEKLKSHLSDFQKNLDELDAAIAEIRAKWEPKLEELVQKISDAFSDSFARIGCAGQVSIDKAEDVIPEYGDSASTSTQADSGDNHNNSTSDFDRWAIRIQVKFREHESLSVLDSHRQSGGERAVSTIFYLMALQSLSSSPFRVVDEINQGMDPRNERMVHERMVDIACASGGEGGGGQYFLITPKLLSGLVYKRGMKVLCIVCGEYVPKDYQKIDFGKCVLRMKDGLRNSSKGKGKGKGKDVDSGKGGVDVER
ncbi:hypothetical protein ACO22_00552 [Paracoccidioides brasiliensis]|uniref:Structural maintenance of chromosomes protein 5 n=1 Tax=Paracoccidioides brasiliensis TaxID=121759 RepID=A0A1D2JNY0_PARBR|nr:hypothetical protein ACO22_00552 [Paracoccidioides brasiliensis]ODH52715.1 hypothetical protein GX48_01204 [Paracoccidioides brasiliensis]